MRFAEYESNKSQAPNSKLQMVRQAHHPEQRRRQYPMTEIQNSKPVSHARFGHWSLEFGVYLFFGACNLGFKRLFRDGELKDEPSTYQCRPCHPG
jgi:hypothetical protein